MPNGEEGNGKTMVTKILKYKQILLSLFLGIVTSWLMKEEITPLLLGGKNFDTRSWFVQIEIMSAYIIFTSLFFLYAIDFLFSQGFAFIESKMGNVMEVMRFTSKKVDNYFKMGQSYMVDLITNRPFLFYFLLVLIVYSIIYLPLLLTGKMYIYLDIGADTYASYWPMYAFIRDYFHNFQFTGWSFQLGLGSSIISAAPLIFDPYNIFIIPFNKNNIDAGIFLAATAKTFSLAVLAFLYMKRLGYRGIPLIASSISYTFCGFFIGWGQHYQFATVFVLFTLVMFCFEGWLISSNWFGFVISISLLAAYSPYNLIMTLVFLAIYYIFRYARLFIFSWRTFFVKSLFTSTLILLGIALAGVIFFPQMYVLTHSPRMNFLILPGIALASINEYYTMLMRLFSNGLLGVNFYSGYSNYYESPFLYTSILTIFLLPRLFFGDTRKKKYVWILFVCVFSFVFPSFVNPIFGAFRGYTYRWTFVLVPIFTAALAEAFTLLENNSHKWIYVVTMHIGIVVGVIALFSKYPRQPGVLGLSIPISVFIVLMFSILYGIALYKFNKKVTPYLLLIALVSEVALTGFVSVNWRGTVPASYKEQTPYFDSSTNKALEVISSGDAGFFRINKVYDYIYLTDALFQGFYGEKQYSSVVAGYIWEWEELFNIREANSTYLLGFSDNQSLRDISAVKYMLTKQKHLYSGYDYIMQVGDTYIYRNNNASSLGLVYKNYISLDNFKNLSLSEKQYILYDAVVVSDEFAKGLTEINEINRPLIKDALPVNLRKEIVSAGLAITENNFPNHLEFVSTDNDPQIDIQLLKPSDTSISVSFSVNSSVDGIVTVYFKTSDGDYNKNDLVSLNLRKGVQDYYVTIPVIGVDAIRLDFAGNNGTFSIDGFSVFHRNDNEISAHASLLKSSGVNTIVLGNDYIRATTDLDYNGLVYFSVPFDEGWKVYVDGKLSEKIRANAAFTGVYVASGEHTIELKYSIPWFKEGMKISIVVFVSMIIFLLAEYKKSASLLPSIVFWV
jgi:uncharacterized membrane protein YfhO